MNFKYPLHSTLCLSAFLVAMILNSATSSADLVNTSYKTNISCPNDTTPWTEKFNGYLSDGSDRRDSGVLGNYFSHSISLKLLASGRLDYSWTVTQQKPGKKKDYWKLRARQQIRNGETQVAFKSYFYFTGVRDRAPCMIEIVFDQAPLMQNSAVSQNGNDDSAEEVEGDREEAATIVSAEPSQTMNSDTSGGNNPTRHGGSSAPSIEFSLLQDQLATAISETNALRKVKQDQENEIGQLRLQIQSLQTSLRAASASNDTLDAQLTAQQLTLQNTQSQLNALLDRSKALEQELQSSKEEAASLKIKISELTSSSHTEEDFRAAIRQSTSLKEKVASLDRELQTLKDKENGTNSSGTQKLGGQIPVSSGPSSTFKMNSDTEVCSLALNYDRTDWSGSKSGASALESAKLRGLTVPNCRNLLGLSDAANLTTAEIEVPGTNSKEEPTVSNSTTIAQLIEKLSKLDDNQDNASCDIFVDGTAFITGRCLISFNSEDQQLIVNSLSFDKIKNTNNSKQNLRLDLSDKPMQFSYAGALWAGDSRYTDIGFDLNFDGRCIVNDKMRACFAFDEHPYATDEEAAMGIDDSAEEVAGDQEEAAINGLIATETDLNGEGNPSTIETSKNVAENTAPNGSSSSDGLEQAGRNSTNSASSSQPKDAKFWGVDSQWIGSLNNGLPSDESGNVPIGVKLAITELHEENSVNLLPINPDDPNDELVNLLRQSDSFLKPPQIGTLYSNSCMLLLETYSSTEYASLGLRMFTNFRLAEGFEIVPLDDLTQFENGQQYAEVCKKRNAGPTGSALVFRSSQDMDWINQQFTMKGDETGESSVRRRKFSFQGCFKTELSSAVRAAAEALLKKCHR